MWKIHIDSKDLLFAFKVDLFSSVKVALAIPEVLEVLEESWVRFHQLLNDETG